MRMGVARTLLCHVADPLGREIWMRRLALVLVALVGLFAAGGASATTITLSTVSSDATLASDLDATLDFSVSGTTMTLTATNTGSLFNVNAIYFNGSASLTITDTNAVPEPGTLALASLALVGIAATRRRKQ